MIEHHYVVIYNSTTGVWYIENQDAWFPDGIIYDTSEGRFRPLGDDKHEIEEDANAFRLLYDALVDLSGKTDKSVGL